MSSVDLSSWQGAVEEEVEKMRAGSSITELEAL